MLREPAPVRLDCPARAPLARGLSRKWVGLCLGRNRVQVRIEKWLETVGRVSNGALRGVRTTVENDFPDTPLVHQTFVAMKAAFECHCADASKRSRIASCAVSSSAP